MIYFKQFLYNNNIYFLITNPNEKNRTFDVLKLNGLNSLPSIEVSAFDHQTKIEIVKTIKQIILAEEIITPFGHINTSNGIIFKQNYEIIPIIKEMIKNENEIEMILQTMEGMLYADKKYLDYYYTHINMEKLKQNVQKINFENICFEGFNNNIMQFSYLNYKFNISKFLSTCYFGVYFPKIEFNKHITNKEVNKIVDILLSNKYFDFGDEIGKIDFSNGIIIIYNGFKIPVLNSTKDKIEVLTEMLERNDKRGNKRFPGLILEKKFQKYIKNS